MTCFTRLRVLPALVATFTLVAAGAQAAGGRPRVARQRGVRAVPSLHGPSGIDKRRAATAALPSPSSSLWGARTRKFQAPPRNALAGRVRPTRVSLSKPSPPPPAGSERLSHTWRTFSTKPRPTAAKRPSMRAWRTSSFRSKPSPGKRADRGKPENPKGRPRTSIPALKPAKPPEAPRRETFVKLPGSEREFYKSSLSSRTPRAVGTYKRPADTIGVVSRTSTVKTAFRTNRNRKPVAGDAQARVARLVTAWRTRSTKGAVRASIPPPAFDVTKTRRPAPSRATMCEAAPRRVSCECGERHGRGHHNGSCACKPHHDHNYYHPHHYADCRPGFYWPWWPHTWGYGTWWGIRWHDSHWSISLSSSQPVTYCPTTTVYVERPVESCLIYRPAPVVTVVEPYDRIARLIDTLRHGTVEDRRAAAEDLGRQKTLRALYPLIYALEYDEDSLVRFYAARSLGKIASRDALPALRKAAREDPQEFVRTEARDAIDDILD